MRLKDISITDVPPVKAFSVSDLSDVVVVAGRNGVGKTRLMQGLVSFFRSPTSYPNIRLVLEATTADERQAWGQAALDTASTPDAQKLVTTLQQSRRRAGLRSSVVQFESDRSIVRIDPYTFTWDVTDPWDEAYGWDGTFAGLRSRFQDTLHSIFRKVRSQEEAIARTAKELRAGGKTTMPLDWPDPLAPFKEAFGQLLAPKELVEANLRNQTLVYRDGSQTFSIQELSSGEREVVNIVFDFLLRNPEDCIVLFDEPELHLHPELSYKLLQTLRNVGARNQFVFSTHSPDIITASLEQSVIFLGPPSDPPQNQAIPVKEQDETNQALRLLGQSVGIIALGKRLVLIEGTTASLDKQVYGSILKNRFPDLVLVPSGGKGLITSFSAIIAEVLERTIWGVDFFMLCDRDAFPVTGDAAEVEGQSQGRLKVLPRYHLENYFLDSEILAQAFGSMEQLGSWLRDPNQIEERLRDIGRTHASYATALTINAHFRQLIGNIDIMPKACHGKTPAELERLLQDQVSSERTRVGGALDPTKVSEMTRSVFARIEAALGASDQSWKVVIPGRQVLNTFAAQAGLNVARLKQLYIKEAEASSPSPFAQVFDLFSGFSDVGPKAAN